MAAVATIAMVGGGALVAAPAAAADVAGGRALSTAGPLVAAGRLASFDSQMLSLVNGARAGAGAPALRSSGGLAQLAMWWSNQMATGATGYQLAHNPNAWSMCASYGASNRTAWAENVAAFSPGVSASAIFNAYMGSPGHRANILNPTYRYVGIGTVSGSKGAFNTMEFTDRVDGAPAAQPKPAPAKPKPAPAKPKPAPVKPAPAPVKPAPIKPKPKPAPAKPKPAPVKPAPASPKPHSAPARVADAMAASPPRSESDSERVMSRPAPARQAVPAPSRGTVLAAFGKLPAAGVTFSIRDRACKSAVSKATTGADGRARVAAEPGSYCAVAVAVPRGVHTPSPVKFTVRPGHDFRVALDDLEPVTVWWRTRGTWLALPL